MDALSSLLGGDSLLGIFSDTINGWMGSLITAAFEKFDDLMTDLLRGVFHFEQLFVSGASTALSEQSIRDVYFYIYGFACSLVILKFLFKGFQIYILWRDGDADVSPRDMLVGMLEAAAVMACFPYLYDKLANICVAFAEGIMGRLGVSLGFSGFMDYARLITGQEEVLMILVALIFAIAWFVLWIQLIGRGFELLILRFGVPLASLGLLDSDMGLFKAYMQVFIKASLTVIVQVCAMALAVRVAGTLQLANIMLALGIIFGAFKTPATLQQFLMPSAGGGGGLTQKAYSAAIVVRTLKGLF